MQLSVLITTIPERINTFYPKLLQHLLKQIGTRTDVEVLGFFDNKKRTVGEKRQALIDLARGRFLVFIDDDDWVSDDYVESIIDAIEDNPQADAIVFDVLYKDVQTGQQTLCKYHPSFENGYTTKDRTQWAGKPCHVHVIRSDIARAERWMIKPPPGQPWTIDAEWARRICSRLKLPVMIDRVLYHYNFDKRSSETLKRNRGMGH